MTRASTQGGAGRARPAWTGLPEGQRVVVRRRRDDASPGEPPFTDVLGHVVRADADAIVVRTRLGEEVRVPAAQVHRAKPVPEAPPRRAPRPPA